MSLTSAEATELFRRPPDRYIDVAPQGGEVGYRRIGTGPDVLFVHGWPVSSATFRRLLPHLVDHVTCHLIDLPGAGQSRFASDTTLTIDNHIRSVRAVVDRLGLDDVAVVGHDSGGMIARHALAGDQRVRAWGLLDTEQPHGPSWRFKMFLAGRHAPGFGSALAWASGTHRIKRSKLVLGGAFVDRDLLDGEFDELFLAPIRESAEYRRATMSLLKSFDYRFFRELDGLHRRIERPVALVWGEDDEFFPIAWAEQMTTTYPNTVLHRIPGAALFAHEERPADVAAALLPTIG